MEKGTYVYCQTRVIGFHKWVNAPEEVKFLRDRHRHEFHIKVTVYVKHDDRDVEFITLKLAVDEYMRPLNPRQLFMDFQGKSCEMIATDLKDALEQINNYHVHSIEVSEDGENGAIVVW